ncbi:MAG: hypothetical protein PHQ11_01460 [Paludibacter sp.]|nr:hypothetical protein [Paludibacter sp.]MDD4198687.1 hypothetical protein [Paludibacter sp.]MDD4427105.1 hypothetical protein [Paludibacter sp.]
MKKVFVGITLMGIVLSSCEKQEDSQTRNDVVNRQKIFIAANELSVKHDSLLVEMLLTWDEKVKCNSLGTSGSGNMNIELHDVFEVIEAVTGVKSEVVKDKKPSRQLVDNINDDDLPMYDFDQEVIRLAHYVNSSDVQGYFDAADQVVLDSTLNVSEKILQINEIQEEVKSDLDLTLVDFENFMNSTEVLKGSLLLWNNYAGPAWSKQKVTGIMRAKPITKWSFFAKLGFVAAADAVGAVTGTFIGSYIVINGVPVYIPAGPQGACAGLAILSFLAAKMVGW